MITMGFRYITNRMYVPAVDSHVEQEYQTELRNSRHNYRHNRGDCRSLLLHNNEQLKHSDGRDHADVRIFNDDINILCDDN